MNRANLVEKCSFRAMYLSLLPADLIQPRSAEISVSSGRSSGKSWVWLKPRKVFGRRDGEDGYVFDIDLLKETSYFLLEFLVNDQYHLLLGNMLQVSQVRAVVGSISRTRWEFSQLTSAILNAHHFFQEFLLPPPLKCFHDGLGVMLLGLNLITNTLVLSILE